MDSKKQQDLKDMMEMLKALSTNGSEQSTQKNESEPEVTEETEEIDGFDLSDIVETKEKPIAKPKPAGRSAEDKKKDLEELMSMLGGLANDTDNSDDKFSDDISKQIKDKEFFKSLSLMSTHELMSKQLNDEVLGMYFDKYIVNAADANKFDYDDRNVKSKNGLNAAVTILGNFYYCSVVRGLYDIDDLYSHFMRFITTGIDRENRAKFAIGILNSYKDMSLEFDEMPSKEKMFEFLAPFMEEDNSLDNDVLDFGVEGSAEDVGTDPFEQFMNLEYEGGGSENVSDMAQVDEYGFGISEPSYSMNGDGVIQLNPRQTQNVIQITDSQIIKTFVPKYETIERFKRKLYQTGRGTSYSFKKLWDLAILAIKDAFPDRTLVTRIALVGEQITVNGKILNLEKILGGYYDVRLEDIIRIKPLLKEFPMVKQLILDCNATQCMIREYGPSAEKVWQLFQQARNLEILGLIPAGGSQAVSFYRHKFASTTDALNNMLGYEVQKIETEQFTAYKNPRLTEKSPGYKNKIWKNSKTMAGNLFKVSGQSLADKNPKLMKAIVHGGGGIIIIGIGGLLAMGGRTIDGIKRLSRSFR